MSLNPNRKHALILIAALIPIILLLAGIANASDNGNVVRAIGRPGVKINEVIFATFRFSPGKIQVHQGDTIVFQDVTGVEHTLSIVSASDIQALQTVGQIFACGHIPGDVCINILSGHFPNGPPQGPPSACTPPDCVQEVNVGPTGLDQPGDSVLVLPGGTVAVTVSAPPGTTIRFICAFHPWMQGQIIVG